MIKLLCLTLFQRAEILSKVTEPESCHESRYTRCEMERGKTPFSFFVNFPIVIMLGGWGVQIEGKETYSLKHIF